MPEAWTGALIGKMHNNSVRYEDIAQKLGVSKSYVSMVLNGTRKPKKAKERFMQAYQEVMEEKYEQQVDSYH